MAKRTPETNRRKIIEEQRKKVRARERRNTILTIVVASVVGIGLIAAAVYFGQQSREKQNQALNSIGVTPEAAGCTEVKEEPIPKEASDEAVKHTNDRVEYNPAPPSSGRHHGTWLPAGNKRYYSRTDNPPAERAVHNLEHGYTVVWYDNKVTDAQVALLEQIGDSAEGKLLIIPWTRADFPDEKHIVITSWSMKQACSDVSGGAIEAFKDKYGGPNSKAPEKNAI